MCLLAELHASLGRNGRVFPRRRRKSPPSTERVETVGSSSIVAVVFQFLSSSSGDLLGLGDLVAVLVVASVFLSFPVVPSSSLSSIPRFVLLSVGDGRPQSSLSTRLFVPLLLLQVLLGCEKINRVLLNFNLFPSGLNVCLSALPQWLTGRSSEARSR